MQEESENSEQAEQVEEGEQTSDASDGEDVSSTNEHTERVECTDSEAPSDASQQGNEGAARNNLERGEKGVSSENTYVRQLSDDDDDDDDDDSEGTRRSLFRFYNSTSSLMHPRSIAFSRLWTAFSISLPPFWPS